MRTAIENVSRRGFVKGMFSAGAFVLAVHYVPGMSFAEEQTARSVIDHAPLHPSVYVGVESDGTVYIVAHRSEMGTSSRTSLPLILADELDADWNRVKIEQAIGDPRYGSQDTDGSKSVREFFNPMREAGATTRLMLTRAAAQQWGVSPDECTTGLHQVIHSASGRKADYGQLVTAAAKLPVPAKGEVRFKPRSQWRYIGKGENPYDLRDYCTGKANFGIDAKTDGMLYAVIAHPPVLGGKVKILDDKQALQVKGVRQTITIETFKPPCHFQPLGGVAVLADNTWAAMQGRKQLKIDWDDGPNASYNSEEFKKQLQETARKPGKVWRNQGDVDAEFAKGGKIIEADYYLPHLAHASMEPPMALADVRGDRVEVWTCTQNPQAVQESIGPALGIPKENVTCHVTLLGGGFGRKSKPDYAVEAAVLSKKTGKPVKVVWSREDDIRFDYYHAVSAAHMKATVDAKGKPTAWLQRNAFPTIGSTFQAGAESPGAGELQQGWTDIPYDLPNLRVENGPAPAHVRIGWLRSVANIYQTFAVQTFTAELAANAGRDHIEFALDLIGPPRIINLKAMGVDYPNYGASLDEYPVDTARLRHVIELVAEKSGWGKEKPGNGVGYGFAAHRSFLTYVACVVKVQVNDDGDITIPRVDYVVDAGTVVNPDRTKSQFEGAAVFGTSVARYGEITAKNGVIEQSNFNDYPVTRINEAPYQTNVYLVENDAPPAGVGEPGVPPFVPALCNAISAATGQRIRELPLSKLDFSKTAKS
jgi:isoquinoline 1-oxidoreductase beta subunit